MRTRTRLAVAAALILIPSALLAAHGLSAPSESKTSIRPCPELEAHESPEEMRPCCDSVEPPALEVEEGPEVEIVDVDDIRRRTRRTEPELEPIPVDDAGEALTRIAVSEANFEVSDDELDALALVAYHNRSRCEPEPPRGNSPGITECELRDGRVVDVDPFHDTEPLDGHETLLSVLRRLSPRTTVARTGFRMSWRVRWITTLPPPSSTAAPAGWVECAEDQRPTRGVCHGRWDGRRHRLEDIRRRARRRIVHRPANRCDGRPMTWGGSMDRHILEARNARRAAAGLPLFELLDCGDTANDIYGFRPTPARAAGELERSEGSTSEGESPIASL
ncbi:MAG TPA: hypothetical protein ENK57_23660 [Polyangiaceae bacterium]|nr:hypothetical protein [Polyangiaceae bacterium]